MKKQMPRTTLTKLIYQTLQGSKGLAGIAHKELSTKAMEVLSPGAMPEIKPISEDLLIRIRDSMTKLAELDWEEAENNVYPKKLLFKAPWIEWAKTYPLIWLDLPSTWERRRKHRTREIPKGIASDIY